MAFEPEKITKEHISSAIQIINSGDYIIAPSTKFDVVIDGKPYPPKEVMRFAHFEMNGEHIWNYGGGEPTNKFLKKLGYQIVEKGNDPLKELVIQYKQKIRANGNQDEIYKWQLVKRFQTIWQSDIPFIDKINKVNFSNLLYYNAIVVLKQVTTSYPKEVEKMFTDLFTEGTPLQQRLDNFKNGFRDLYSEMGHSKLATHQDGRTIATYLTFQSPENYTFFKNSFYGKLCNLLSTKKQKPEYKYTHYLQLVNDFVEEYIKSDHELQEIKNGFIDDTCDQDINNLILAQDILYQTLDIGINKGKKYWRIGTKEGENSGLSKWSVMLDNGYISIGWPEIGNLDDQETINKQVIIQLLKDEGYYKDDNRTASQKAGEILSFYESIKIGDIILAQDGQTVLGIGEVSDNYEFNDEDSFPHIHRVDWKVKSPKLINQEGLRTTVYPLSDKILIGKIEELLDSQSDQQVNIHNTIQNMPLNVILYGPPGTGKTYNSIPKALEIIEDFHVKNQYSDEEWSALKKQYEEYRSKGQIEFVTFHQNYSYEDFMVGIKPDASSENLKFKPYLGIFYKIANRARENYLLSKGDTTHSNNFETVFNRYFDKLISEEVSDVAIKMKREGYQFKITFIDFENNKIKFTKKSGGTGHDLLISNVKGIYDGALNYPSDGLGIYYYPLVEELKQSAKQIEPATVSKESLKKFVLVIDEINRANISRVFGELITLLEDDKRLDKANELKVTLPNGEVDFGLSPNLYIIGTMNTADKSIALLDIALRRRFEFIGYYPDYEVLMGKQSEYTSILKEINKRIYKKKNSADYLIGHAYFMKGGTLAHILIKKVIPLLMEYFPGRIKDVLEILEGLVEVKYDEDTYKWIVEEKK